MAEHILEPAMLTSPTVALLGGKALSLYRLGQISNTRVPPWFAVSADAFGAAVEAAGVGEEMQAALAQLAAIGPEIDAVTACAAKLAPLLEKLRVGDELREAIGAAYERMDGGFVAVRSSAIDEDGAERSFAGCLDTSLFVRGAEDVASAVERCWRSAFSERSLTYRAAQGALEIPIRVATVVQKMISGDVSGVLFTADPSTGARERTVVTSTWGLGEGVVSGRLACDTFALDRATSAVLEEDIVDKSHTIVHDIESGSGTHEIEVPADKRSAPTLDGDRLRTLAEIGWAIEETYGTPVDIEWTWATDGPWILQARPITTGGAATSPLPRTGGQRRLWDNSNIIESYAGVTTPLTYSFARKAYSIVYRQSFELLGVPQRELEANARTFDQMIGLLRGRIYYNLESWYRALQLLPGYKFNAEFMEQMMGVTEAASFGRDSQRASAAQRYMVELPRLMSSLAQLASRFARSEKLVERFYENFGEAYSDFDSLKLSELSYDELVSTYLDAERRILQRWQAPIVNDILAMIFFGALRKTLSSWGLGDDATHNDLLCGEGGMESTEPTRDLLALMVDVRKDEALCTLLEESPLDEIGSAIATDPRFEWLEVRIEQHVDRFGDRCVDELKLEEPTLRDDPTFLYAAIKGYLSAPPVTVEDMETREKAIRQQAEDKVYEVLRHRPDRRRIFEWLLRRARLHVKNRENLRFARTRAFGLVRRLVLAMGERLVASGHLDRADDVFYLEVGELVAFSRGLATTTDLRGLAAVRRREFDGHRAAPTPADRFWTEGAVYMDPAVLASRSEDESGDRSAATSGTVLTGVGASPGVVRAKARLVEDPRGAVLRQDVLVANRTDPGWVPLFPNACAVVVERGSVLSHSAIVAREFGIPCVVGVRGALARLRDGQEVEVDGGAGRITALED